MSIASRGSGDDHTVDRDNVGHGEESSETSTELGEEAGIFAFLGLQMLSVHVSDLM